ncbi:MAG: oligosaccharide flippase family protein [Flavobacteriales bacterium]|nr:oligosaccharide flippase family protein [Flavobacteriales bacterium]
MQGTFLRNLVFVVVLNLVVKPFYILGIDAGVQERVGAEVYGVYAALLSLSFLLNIVLDLGITNHNTRYLSQHPELMREQFAGIVGVRLVLVVLYASVCLCAGFVLGYGAEQLNLLGWLILNQALAAMLLYLRSNIAAMQRYAVDSLLSVLDRALLIGLVGWLLWGRGMHEEFRIEWFVRAQTLAYSASVFFAFVILRRSVDVLSLRWDRGRAWSILQQSFPYALLILLMTFYYRMDTLMLERLLPGWCDASWHLCPGLSLLRGLQYVRVPAGGAVAADVQPLDQVGWTGSAVGGHGVPPGLGGHPRGCGDRMGLRARDHGLALFRACSGERSGLRGADELFRGRMHHLCVRYVAHRERRSAYVERSSGMRYGAQYRTEPAAHTEVPSAWRRMGELDHAGAHGRCPSRVGGATVRGVAR